MSYLVQAAATAPQAGRAFNRLMGKASTPLAEQAGMVDGLMAAVLEVWASWTEGVRKDFCAGLALLLEHVQPTERAAGYLHQLMSPVLTGMGAVMDRQDGKPLGSAASRVVAEALSLVSSVLWSETRPADAAGEALPPPLIAWQAVRLSMVQGTWELLERVERSAWEDGEDVQAALCRLYDDVLKMVRQGPYASQWVPPIIQRAARCYAGHPQPAALTVLEDALPLLKASPALFPQLCALLPGVLQTTVATVGADPAGHVDLFFAAFHLLSLFVLTAAQHFMADMYRLFPAALALSNRVLVEVDDGCCQAAAAQLYVELLFSINARAEQRARVEVRSAADESDEKRSKREAWTALWAGQVEQCVQSLLAVLLARPYRDRDVHPSSSFSSSPSASPTASDDDDDESTSSSHKDRSRMRAVFRPKAMSFLFHTALSFGDVVWRCVEREVRRAGEKAGWSGEDMQRVLLQLRQWLVDGEQRRWQELFEDVRRLVHGEEQLDVMLAYEMAWAERRKREDDKSRRAGGLGASKHLAINLV